MFKKLNRFALRFIFDGQDVYFSHHFDIILMMGWFRSFFSCQMFCRTKGYWNAQKLHHFESIIYSQVVNELPNYYWVMLLSTVQTSDHVDWLQYFREKSVIFINLDFEWNRMFFQTTQILEMNFSAVCVTLHWAIYEWFQRGT